MKKYIISLIFATVGASISAQHTQGIAHVLQEIENNNLSLKAIRQDGVSQKALNKAENNLANPTVSYAHLWDSKDKNITVGELVVAQSFDFPTLYATRAKMNRAKNQAVDAGIQAGRQAILLQAQEVCLDIIMLHQQQQLLDERLKNAEELAELYRQRLKAGDANALEVNKINLELLNVRTESRTNATALQGKLKELMTLNDNRSLAPGRPLPGSQPPGPGALGLTEYPDTPLPADIRPLTAELLDADAGLKALESEREAAKRDLSLGKQGWLPGLELGYRRNTEDGHPLNGMVVGFSIPIFQNQGKVKAARANHLSASLQVQSARMQAETALWQLYDEASSLQASIREYQEAFRHQQDLKLLKQALTGGQISMIEYFVEVSVLFQSHTNLIQLENQYEKAMARLYKSKL